MCSKNASSAKCFFNNFKDYRYVFSRFKEPVKNFLDFGDFTTPLVGYVERSTAVRKDWFDLAK
jgi:hypothetical protein